MLQASGGPLVTHHELLMFDLDGVVYIGGVGIEGVPESISRARRAGCHVAFVTNNASLPPEDVAAKLRKVGVEAESRDVVTSAQAAARLLVEAHGVGAEVVLLGGTGLEQALRAEGLRPRSPAEGGVAVVSGYGLDVSWRDIMRAAVLIRDGLPYVASNTDGSVPTEFGLAPGHGALVRLISEFAGVEPVVAGKPSRPLLDETIRRVGGERPLMVGDRLDTDIEGANRIGVDSFLVLTGVTGLEELAAASRGLRPTYISVTTAGLFDVHNVPEQLPGKVGLGGWQGGVDESGSLWIRGSGSADDWWRVGVTACWRYLDETGRPADVAAVRPPGPVCVGVGE